MTEYVKKHLDYVMFFSTVLLVSIGVTMSYSASAVLSGERYGSAYFFLKKTIFYAVIGFTVLLMVARVHYLFFKKLVYPILAVCSLLVLMVFIPGVGHSVGGATRWLTLGPVNLQPSEALKLAVIIFMAYSLEKKDEKMGTFGFGFVYHLVALAIFSSIVLIQKDFGSAMTIIMVGIVMMVGAGIRWRYLLISIAMLIPAAVWLIMSSGYRLRRIAAFMNPWQDQYGSGFQVIQSLVAFNQGGWFGKGLGQGQQKLFYLPEAHTDFIFSVIGEELGFVGCAAVVALFAVFCYRGLYLAIGAKDLFGRYLIMGVTTLICMEAVLNMGVVMGLLPPKGMALPFISYGGSSLIMSLAAVGIILSVSAYGRQGDA